MSKPRKRKTQLELQRHEPYSSPKKPAPISGSEPYPDHPWPSPSQCRAVRDELLALHGFPEEFAKYRRVRPGNTDESVGDPKSEPLSGDDPKGSVLDGLVRTVLSQNTTEVNSLRAFASLKSAVPTWQSVSLF